VPSAGEEMGLSLRHPEVVNMGLKSFPVSAGVLSSVAVVLALIFPVAVGAATAWPGESWSASTNLTSLNPTGWVKNLSGAYWNPATRRLWVCTNNPARFWSLREDGSGGFLIEREFTGTGDLEGITQIGTAADRAFLLDEQARTIRSYRVSDGATLTSWFLGTIPDWGNSGPEGIAFVPDAWLARNAFLDGSGVPYPQSVHGANGFGGVVFVAVQTSGWVYAFDLRTDGTYTFVGRYLTSRAESCELTFDESIGKLYVLHNIDGNLLQITDLTSVVAGSDRRFNTIAEIQVPSASNIEGFALTPALTAGNAVGEDWCFFTDDDNASGALRWFKQLHSRLEKHAGDGQTAEAGSAVAIAPSVLVADPFSNPLPGVAVTFAMASGGGSVTGGSATTGPGGVATVGGWILGPSPGANTLGASGVNLNGSPQSFTATGVDHTAPTASFVPVAPDPRSAAVDSIRIVFSEPVVNFDLADLQLTRDGGPDLLTGAESLATSDGMTWDLGMSALTATGGTYVLTLSPSDITDQAGNPLVSGASDSWLMVPTASTGKDGPGAWDALLLGPPVPNPGREGLRIPFTLPRESPVTLTVFDVRGRRVRTVAQGTFTRGPHWAVWDGRCVDGTSAQSGVYFYRLQLGGTVLSQRGFLVR
jgi:hypothetical protein